MNKGFQGALSRYAHAPIDLVTLHQVNDKILHLRRKLAEIFESAVNLGINVDNKAHVSGHAR
jgi:hypothetical protein